MLVWLIWPLLRTRSHGLCFWRHKGPHQRLLLPPQPWCRCPGIQTLLRKGCLPNGFNPFMLYLQMFNFISQVFGTLFCRFKRGFRQDNNKLLTAVTADYIAQTGILLQKSSEFLQKRIACVMPKRIIVFLKIIYIQHYYTDRSALSAGAVYLASEGFIKVAAVKKPCKRVVHRHIAQHLTEFYIRERKTYLFGYCQGKLPLVFQLLLKVRRVFGRGDNQMKYPKG